MDPQLVFWSAKTRLKGQNPFAFISIKQILEYTKALLFTMDVFLKVKRNKRLTARQDSELTKQKKGVINNDNLLKLHSAF